MKKVIAVCCLCAVLSILCACQDTPANMAQGTAGGTAQSGGSHPAADRTVALGGCQITIPEGYTVHIDDGVVITHPDYNWQMLCVVKDRPYTEGKSDPSLITKGVEEAGYDITKGVDFATLDGREYAYFTYTADDDSMMLVNTEAPGDKTMAGLLVLYGGRTEEDALRELHTVFSTITASELPDTTEEELIGRGLIEVDITGTVGEGAVRTAAVTYQLEDFAWTAGVPQGFYWKKAGDEAENPSKNFISDDGRIEAFVNLMENFAYDDLRDCVRGATQLNEDYENAVLSDIMSETVEGTTVYYQTLCYDYYWEYKNERLSYQRLVAVAAPADGYYLQLTAERQGEGTPLTFETVRAFFEKGDPANVNTLAQENNVTPEKRLYIATAQEAEQALREDSEAVRRQSGNAALAALEKRMEKNYGLYGVNLGEMPLPVAEKVEKAFEDMYKAYPQLKGVVTNLSVAQVPGNAVGVTVYHTFIQNVNSLYPAVYKLEIQLDKDTFENENKLSNIIENAVKENHWMQDTNVQALVAHELGHALLDRIAMESYGLETHYYITQQNAEAFSQYVTDGLSANQYTAFGIISKAYDAYCAAHPGTDMDQDDFRASISGYAFGGQEDGGISYSETFAEAVADKYLHKDNMCEASALILQAAGLG